MALKRIPADMSYQAIRHKHQPGSAKKTVERESSGPVGDAPKTTGEETEKGQEEGVIPGIAAPSRLPDLDREPDNVVAKKVRKQTAEAKPKPGGNVKIRGYVYPQKGARFSQLVDIYGEGEAIGLGLTSGMSLYEAALSDADQLGPPPHLEKVGQRVETSRTMTADLYAKAVQHVDPMGVLGKSQVGTRILNVALRYYVDQT